MPHHPAAPQMARLHGVAALCARRAGEPALAARWESLARAALRAQPGVSPYFSAPLRALDAGAGGRRRAG
jgi:hypothetical protein